MKSSRIGAKIGFLLAAVAIVAVAGLVAFGGSGSAESASSPDAVALPAGPPAPAATFELLGGGSTSFADFQGRPVVANFFADWCPACVAELPDLQAVHEEFGEEVAFLGLDRSSSEEGLRALLDETGVTYDVALDRDGTLFQAFEGFAMPTTIFISPSGEVVDRQNGVIFEQDLKARLDTLLGNA